MKEFIRPISTKLTQAIKGDFSSEEMVFFDIETTGFAPEKSSLYLIGCIYKENDEYFSRQWFVDEPAFEMEAIASFMDFLSKFKSIVHYNGAGFDIPYLIQKCSQYNISHCFNELNSIDLYKLLTPYKTLFKTENLKQKTMEKFLNINREDKYNGGELIKVYQDYCSSPTDEKLRLLILHNHNDLTGLISILPLLDYSGLNLGEYSVKEVLFNTSSTPYSGDKKELMITLNSDRILPVRVSIGNEHYYLTAYKDTIKLCINVYTDELKYFYPNYKDYYYLPEEDRSIHKSVAFYVDKNFRTKAKAANCYSKKTGTFLPQYEEIITPFFKIDYHDKICYFECVEEFINNNDSVYNYSQHIIKILLNHKTL